MNTILIVLLTLILVLDSLFLGLLVLVQLPKKEAGIGMAFGGGAADALFGAGSGTALSNLTKYSATIFFVLVFILSVMITHAYHGDSFRRSVNEQPIPLAPNQPVTAPSQLAPTVQAMPTVPMNAVSNSTAAAIIRSNIPVVPAK